MLTDKESCGIALGGYTGSLRRVSAFTSLSEVVFEFPVERKGNQRSLEIQKHQFPSITSETKPFRRINFILRANYIPLLKNKPWYSLKIFSIKIKIFIETYNSIKITFFYILKCMETLKRLQIFYIECASIRIFNGHISLVDSDTIRFAAERGWDKSIG